MRKIITIALLVLLMNSVQAAASFTFTTPVCGLVDSFTNTSTGTNVGYVWYFDDPGSGSNNLVVNSTKITQPHTFTTYGTYNVRLYIVDINNQAVDSVVHTVVVIQPPNLFIIPNSFPTYCDGDSVNTFLTATTDPAYKYVWSPTPSSYTAPNSVEYRFTHTQTYTVVATDTTTGCSNTKSVTVTFNNCTPLTSQFTFVTPPCGVFTVNFRNTSLKAHHFKWYFGDPASGANDSILKADTGFVTHTFSDTGLYYVSLVVFDSLETKQDSSVKQVRIFKQSLANIYNNDTTVCLGTNVTLNGMGIGTATWSSVSNLSTTTGYTTVASPQSTSTYYLTTNNNGCMATDSIVITVITKPDPGFIWDTLCMNESYTFTANTGGYPFYHWDFGTGDTANGVTATYSFDTSGTFNVKLYVFNGFCDSLTIVQVIVLNDPIAAFLPDKMKAEITKATFQFSNTSNYAVSYFWDFGDVTTSTQISPTHTFLDTGWYRVTLTAVNNLGCDDTFSVMIRVDNVYKYFVPSAFSPNLGGPSENEVFKAFGPAGTTQFEMVIFDRWGAEIFISTSEKTPWVGKYGDGRECPPGNYVYSIKFKDPTGKRLVFKGIVTLCR